MIDEGYIKYEAFWHPSPPFEPLVTESLILHRQLMLKYDLIGAYPDGIGFGNISQRNGQSNSFVISGSATGSVPMLSSAHFSLVLKTDPFLNKLWCTGPHIASSEAMSHAAFYNKLPGVKAVIHVHHEKLWKKFLFHLPTTAVEATYGSPEMVHEINRLLDDPEVVDGKLLFMAGHTDGIFAFGEDLEALSNKLISLLSAL
jgi:ribulose-5-phosphate 4-epimerase/fuculose-1-phosphate aldolase